MENIQTSEDLQLKEARKDLLIFWLRMIGWLVACIGAPVTTFALKFGLFDTSSYEFTTAADGTSVVVALNGWGIVSCLLVGYAAYTILTEVIDAYSNKYSLVKQCLVGLKNKLLPIIVILVVCCYLKGVLDNVIFCLTVIGISQVVAIPLNPLPQWKSKKKGVEDYSDLLSGVTALVKDLKSKKGGK